MVMNYRNNVTQTLKSDVAKQAILRLMRDLDLPKSAVLEHLLTSITTDDLIGLSTGRLSLHEAKVVSLDAQSLIAVRNEISQSLSSLWPSLTETNRLATTQAIERLLVESE